MMGHTKGYNHNICENRRGLDIQLSPIVNYTMKSIQTIDDVSQPVAKPCKVLTVYNRET